jgi:chromosome partitioning protein
MAPPHVIAVGGLKGGLGKTTIAVFIALVYAITRGKKVLFVDADPKSQSGYDWHKLAKAAGRPLPFDIEVWPHGQVGSMVAERAEGYDVVVIDTGGDSDAILASAVEVASYVLLVTTPSKPDMRRLAATFQAALTAAEKVGRADEVDAAVVFTKVDQRRAAYNEEIRGQVAERLPLLSAGISLKASLYADNYGLCPSSESELAEAEAVVKEMEAA